MNSIHSLRDSKLTERIVEYGRSTDYEKLPDDVVDRAKRVILDDLGCTVLGSTMMPGSIMRQYVASMGGVPEATIVGGGVQVPAALAALANGTSAHSDELDTIHLSETHPGASAISTALALCEAGQLSGKEFINAVVLQTDISCRLVTGLGGRRAIHDAHSILSDVLHGLGAATAAARVLRLEQMPARHALAIASLQLFMPAAFFDERTHMTKAMHYGQVAYAGITGARLASFGFEGNESIVEAKDGIVDAWIAAGADIQEVTADLGNRFSIMDTGNKYFSAGYPIHAPLAGALDVIQKEDIAIDDILAIRVGMTTIAADIVDDRAMPSICIQDMLAVGIVLGRLDYEDAHNEDVLKRGDVQRLRETIAIVRDPDMDARSPRSRAAWLELDVRGRGTVRGPERLAPGHWELGGMPWNDVRRKFISLVEPRLGSDVAAEAISLVEGLESVGDVGELGRILGKPALGTKE